MHQVVVIRLTVHELSHLKLVSIFHLQNIWRFVK